MITEIFVKVSAVILLVSVAVVLILGIGTLFKGGDTSKKYSNKLMPVSYTHLTLPTNREV